MCLTEGFSVLNRGIFVVALRGFGVELRGMLIEGFLLGTEGFWGLKGVALLCGTDVLN